MNGINENNTVLDWQDLLRIHMPGYYQSIKKGVSSIMVSYSSWNGVKMHTNRHLITDFLKGTLGFEVQIPYTCTNQHTDNWSCDLHCYKKFQGFVISDWEGVDKITYPPHANYSDSLLKAISAGIDMVRASKTHQNLSSPYRPNPLKTPRSEIFRVVKGITW